MTWAISAARRLIIGVPEKGNRTREQNGTSAAQIDRLRYVLSQTCKEGLVSSPLDWPGAHCAQALLDGSTVRGLWFDRTREEDALLVSNS